MDPAKNPPSSSGTCPGSTTSSSSGNNTGERHAFSEPEIVPRTVSPVARRPRQGQRIRQFARGSHTPVPTTQQAVVLDWVPGTQLDTYIAIVGNIVAPANIRYASLVQPNRVCLFVSDAQMAQTLHGRTVNVEGHTLLIQPLIQPLARVLATNVYPFIEDQTIRTHLALHHGVLVRDIVHVGADTQLPEYSHVMGFARHLYVPPEQLPIVPGRIMGQQADWPYLIYLGSEEQRCSSCRQVGHLARYCAMDQRCIGVYGTGSTTDRRSSISSGGSSAHVPSGEGPPGYSLLAEPHANVAPPSAPILPSGVPPPGGRSPGQTVQQSESSTATHANVASSSAPILPRGVPPSGGRAPGQTAQQSESSTATNANAASPPISTMPTGGQPSVERTPGKKKKNSSPLAEELAISSPKTPKVVDSVEANATSPKTPNQSKGVRPSLERTPGKQKQKSPPLTEALALMLEANATSPKTPNRPQGVVLPSLKQSPAQRALNMSAPATSPHSRQVTNTINPSPLANPSAPRTVTSMDHSICPFVAAMMGTPASQSNIAADPPAEPRPSRPLNAAAAPAGQSTSAGTPEKAIVRLNTIDTALVQSPPSSATRSLASRAAATCPASGDGRPRPEGSRPRPATPRSRRIVRRPKSRKNHGHILADSIHDHTVRVDRRKSPVPTSWIHQEQEEEEYEEEEEEEELTQPPMERRPSSDLSDAEQ